MVVTCALLACAEEDPAAVFVKMEYQLRCLDCVPRTADEPAHNLRVVDGQGGFRAACTREPWGDLTVFGVSVETFERQSNGNDGFAFEIRQALAGDDPGSSCRISAREGANAYEAVCGADAPSEAIPCQLAMRVDGSIVYGSVACEHIPNLSTAALWRSLYKPSTTEPAEFEVHGCPGL